MATGWAKESAAQEQIDASIADAMARARHKRSSAPSLTHCQKCGDEIPFGRQKAISGVTMCVACQTVEDGELTFTSLHNRRGSKDSQLR